jgi:replicative superfamily II helicase
LDFNKLAGESYTNAPIHPIELFHSLVRAPSIAYLRDVQGAVLQTWHDSRSERDVVVKMNTGAGKTLVGLLMLRSCMNEGLGPAVYVTPDNQLVDQVRLLASEYGIETVDFEGNDVPAEFLNSEAILVVNFKKLFNGRTVFGYAGGPRPVVQLGSVLLDDAHTCLSQAWQQSSIEFGSDHKAYGELLSLFQNTLEQQSRGGAAEVARGNPGATPMLVPYWSWQAVLGDVARILSTYSDDGELKFKWNLIKDHLELCRCIVSGRSIVIAPHVVPVSEVPSYDKAKRRFFLTATIVDDSVLLRDLDVSEKAIRSPLRPKISGDIGERLILAPSLVMRDVIPAHLVPYIQSVVDSKKNVVVLVPSAKRAKFWSDVGAEFVQGDEVAGAVEQLKKDRGRWLVLANRYDGIDLPDDACRLLVLDGLPTGGLALEQYTMSVRPNSAQLRAVQAQRIEQGLGRAVRSGTDYCAVLLFGSDLVNFLSQKQNQSLLSAETRKQVELGNSMARMLQRDNAVSPLKGITDTLDACLGQDIGWKKYHRQQLGGVAPAPTLIPTNVALAKLEREGVRAHTAGHGDEASRAMDIFVSGATGPSDPADRGWYLQSAGALVHETDPARAQELQRKAHELNPKLLKPLAGARYGRAVAQASVQASRIQEWLRNLTEANAVPVAVEAILGRLVFGVESEPFEQALRELGTLLGFHAERPEKEYDCGPDDFWMMPDGTDLVIEAKSMVKLDQTEISKKDIGQLSVSVNWHKGEYPDRQFKAVIVHPVSVAASDAPPPAEAVALTVQGLGQLAERVRNMGAALAAKAPDAWELNEISGLLTAHKLTPGGIRSGLFRPVTTSAT